MKISNKQKISKLKKVFFVVSAVIALATLGIFLTTDMIYGLAGVGVFSMWYLFFHVADYQYIEYNDTGDKIILRYYKAIGFGRKDYSSIDFPKQLLKNVYFENSLFGKLSDLTILIRTKRGVAEYPSVSLSAMSYSDRKKIEHSLKSSLEI